MPPKQRARLQVMKIPLGYQPTIHPVNFPSMPRLYMELLENKAKIRPELRNQEYVTKNTSPLPSLSVAEQKTKFSIDEEGEGRSVEESKEHTASKLPPRAPVKTGKKPPLKIVDLDNLTQEDMQKWGASLKDRKDIAPRSSRQEKEPEKHTSLYNFNPPVSRSGKASTEDFLGEESMDQKYRSSKSILGAKALGIRHSDDSAHRETSRSAREAYKLHVEPFGQESDIAHKHRDDPRRTDDRDDRRHDNDDRRHRSDRHHISDRSGHRHRDDDDGHRDNNDSRKDRYRDSGRHRNEDSYSKDNDRGRHRDEDNHDTRRSDKDDSRRDISSIIAPSTSANITLEDILSGKDSGIKSSRPTTVSSHQKEPSPAPQRTGIPPTLADIAAGRPLTDDSGIRDINRITDNEKVNATKVRDILFKFKILRRVYKEATIPEFSEHTPLETLEREYESIVRQVALEATVANFKKYLMIGWFCLEFVLGNLLKIEDIKGFTENQLLGMNQYESLLFQIGEKSYFTGRKWSPEVKLLGMILLNGAVFVGSKMLFRATGSSLTNLLNHVNQPSQQNHPQQPSNQPGGKPKMRAPDINLSDLGAKKQS